MIALAASPAAEIVRVIWSSILASVVVAGMFSAAVVGLIRASELRRASRGRTAAAYTAAGILALTVCVVAVVYGLILVGQKS
jgi:uncharacterized membrane protein YidH (DUF202 family)